MHHAHNRSRSTCGSAGTQPRARLRLGLRSARDAASTSQPFVYLQLDLPPAQNMRVKQAVFVKSSHKVKACPPDIYPEFAMIGRSNVGKSSLINMLTEQAGLAHVSKEPGKLLASTALHACNSKHPRSQWAMAMQA